MKISELKRVFKFKKDSKDIVLSDPNPNMSADQVMDFYSSSYPELTTSTVNKNGVLSKNGDALDFEFETTLGTKG
jgi:PRTRC genetic system protein C